MGTLSWHGIPLMMPGSGSTLSGRLVVFLSISMDFVWFHFIRLHLTETGKVDAV
jgi:hypothetical protein